MALLSKIALMSVLLPQALAANLCMDVPDTGVDPLNSDVQIWGCNGLPNQQWDVDDYYIKDAQHGYCLALPDGDTTNGKRVQLQDSCTGHTWSHDAQGWTFADGDWHIRYKADPSKCLDAGGDMQAGIELMIWDCNDLPQQIWGYDADAKTIYLADSRRLQHSAGAAQTNLTLPAEEDLGSPNLTAQAEENLTAQAEDNLTAQAEEYLSGNSGKALRGSLRSLSAQCKQLSGTYCAGGGQACDCAYCDDFSKNDECANTCRVMNGYFSSPFREHPWAPVYLENPVNAPDGTDCSWMKGNGYGGQGDDCKHCDDSAMKCRRANPPHIGATYQENSGGNCKAW
jgi:hypothetical protein